MIIREELDAVMKWLHSEETENRIREANLSVYFVVAEKSKATEAGVGAMIMQNYVGKFDGMVAISSAMLESFYDRLDGDQKKILTIAAFSAITEHNDIEKGGTS